MTKQLAAEKIRLNAVDLIQQGVDPSGGGVSAAIGSFYLRSGTGQAWLKTGAADPNWTQLVQSFAWFSVRDYGAVGNGVTDDTAAIQQAINDCATAGGGVVFFPFGTYAITQLTINAQNNVQLLGSGMASVLKWVFNAGGAAGSMVTVQSGSTHTRFSLLRFDGSGLTNPAAGLTNHLLAIGTGAGGAVTEIQIFNCQFGAMVANSGDGVHVLGAAGNLVSRLMIVDNNFDGCSRFSVGVEQGWEFGWIESNYMTNCTTEIGFVSTADVVSNAISITGNEIVHTGATRHAVRLEGGATTFITRLIVANNVIFGGFATLTNILWAVCEGNVQTSGNFASADSAWRIFGNVTDLAFNNNIIDRGSGASVGVCLSLEKSGSSPSMVRVGQNMLINETVGGGFVKVVDCTRFSIGGNQCRVSDAGVSTMFGIEAQAVTLDLTDALLGPSNLMTAGANSMAACVHLLANGANIKDCSVVGNQGDNCDYGLAVEVGGGGGAFTGQLLYGGNNINSTVGDIHQIGVTVRPKIGFNASTLGINAITGTGSPEGVVTARVGSLYFRSDGGQATAVYYKESGTGNTGWLGIGASPIIFGTGDTTAGAGPVFLAPGWIATATATEVQFQMTRSGTLRNLRVQAATAGVGADTNVYTVRKNGADTTITASIGNTATGGTSDTTHSVTVVAGDLVSVDMTRGGAVATGQQNVTAALEVA